jgi:hypothetical protein
MTKKKKKLCVVIRIEMLSVVVKQEQRWRKCVLMPINRLVVVAVVVILVVIRWVEVVILVFEVPEVVVVIVVQWTDGGDGESGGCRTMRETCLVIRVTP